MANHWEYEDGNANALDYFGVSAHAVHQKLKMLQNNGFVGQTPPAPRCHECDIPCVRDGDSLACLTCGNSYPMDPYYEGTATPIRYMDMDGNWHSYAPPLPDHSTTLEQLLEQRTVAKHVLQHGLSVVADRLPKSHSRSLYSIGDDLLALEWLLLEAEGVLEPGEEEQIIDRWFNDLRGERDQKLDDYAGLIRATSVRAAVRKGEIDRMGKLLRADSHLADKLKERLLFFLERTGETKIETPHFRIRRQNNGGQLALDWRISEDRYSDLPEPLREERTTYVPNQKEIRKALDAAVAAHAMRMDHITRAARERDPHLGVLVESIVNLRHPDAPDFEEFERIWEEAEEALKTDTAGTYEALSLEERKMVDFYYPPTEAEKILAFVDYKPRGQQVRID